MKKRIIVNTVVLLLTAFSVTQAQDKFRELDSKNGIDFAYRWQAEKKSKSDSLMILTIKIKNNNGFKARVEFTVDYYYQTIRNASSEPQIYCVSSKKALVGKIKKMGFDRAGYTNEQLMSDEFIVELSDIKVTKSPKCKKKVD